MAALIVELIVAAIELLRITELNCSGEKVRTHTSTHIHDRHTDIDTYTYRHREIDRHRYTQRHIQTQTQPKTATTASNVLTSLLSRPRRRPSDLARSIFPIRLSPVVSSSRPGRPRRSSSCRAILTCVTFRL